MSNTGNKEIVRAFMAAQTSGDLAEQRRLLQDDVTFHIPASGARVLGIPLSTQGADKYIETRRAAMGKLYKSHARDIDMKYLIAEDDIVVAFYHMTTELAAGGAYANDYVFVYRLKDEKIAEIWENADTASAYLQFGYKIAK